MLLYLGLILWSVVHLFPMMAPGMRASAIARLGEGPYKGLYALASVGTVVMMVLGYQAAPFVAVWTPPGWAVHLNNLLMLVAVLLFGAKHAKSSVRHHLRHPMLLSAIVWAVAHLLVNGDLASLFLFGGILVWALAAIAATNRRDPEWSRPPPGTTAGLVRHILITLVVFAVMTGIHGPLLGVWPFPG